MQSLIVLHLNIMCLGFFLANPKLKIVTINKKTDSPIWQVRLNSIFICFIRFFLVPTSMFLLVGRILRLDRSIE